MELELGDDTRVNKTLEKYHNCCYNAQGSNTAFGGEPQSWYQEISRLKAKFEYLQRSQRHMLGEDLGPLSIKELQQLEKQLEYALSQARQRKTQIMMEQVDELRRKERELGELNKQLKSKLEAEGCSSYKAVQTSWAPDATVSVDGRALSVPNAHPGAAMDCEPTLQIGYEQAWLQRECFNAKMRCTSRIGHIISISSLQICGANYCTDRSPCRPSVVSCQSPR